MERVPDVDAASLRELQRARVLRQRLELAALVRVQVDASVAVRGCGVDEREGFRGPGLGRGNKAIGREPRGFLGTEMSLRLPPRGVGVDERTAPREMRAQKRGPDGDALSLLHGDGLVCGDEDVLESVLGISHGSNRASMGVAGPGSE